MSTLLVRHAERPLSGSVPLPCDPLIARRLLVLGALSAGACELTGIGLGSSTSSLAGALSALGVPLSVDERRIGVRGVGLWGLHTPERPLDAGACGDTLALLVGLLAGQRFPASVIGSVAAHDAAWIGELVEALRRRGARIEGPALQDEQVVVQSSGLGADERLGAIEWPHGGGLPVKTALLISGLFAGAPTELAESLVSIDHTERAFDALSLPVLSLGSALELHPPADAAAIRAFDGEVPGDFAAAEVLLGIAAALPGSRITLRGSGLNPSRTGSLDWLRQLGGRVGITPHGARLGEPIGDLSVSGAELAGGPLGGELWTRMGRRPSLPLLLGSVARGTTEVGDVAAEDVPRLERLAVLARRFGVRLELGREMMRIDGGPASLLTPSCIESHGDAEVVMLAASFGLLAPGETEIRAADCVASVFPRFAGTLRALGAAVEVRA